MLKDALSFPPLQIILIDGVSRELRNGGFNELADSLNLFTYWFIITEFSSTFINCR